jgi:hypothetical protein
MNTSANILALILVNYALACEAQTRGDVDECNRLGAAWHGLQAAFSYVCKAEGVTKRVACVRHAKEARATALAAGTSRKWLLTVPQITRS